jgi:hypothetical protein
LYFGYLIAEFEFAKEFLDQIFMPPYAEMSLWGSKREKRH